MPFSAQHSASDARSDPCRHYAEKQGWTIVGTYHERTVSGASLVRIGIQAILVDALAGHFDVLLSEALDRISGDQSSAVRQALAKIDKATKGIILAIEDGMYQPSMKGRMDDLERQKPKLMARLAAETPPPPDVNPNVAEIYRRKVQNLSDALADPVTAEDATAAVRLLIGEIVLTPGAKRVDEHSRFRGWAG